MADVKMSDVLQMDLDFLKSLKALPTIVVVNQVDRLRPIREWEPPYNWRSGTRPKEISIREAINYRATLLNTKILPLVTWDSDRAALRYSRDSSNSLNTSTFWRHR